MILPRTAPRRSAPFTVRSHPYPRPLMAPTAPRRPPGRPSAGQRAAAPERLSTYFAPRNAKHFVTREELGTILVAYAESQSFLGRWRRRLRRAWRWLMAPAIAARPHGPEEGGR